LLALLFSLDLKRNISPSSRRSRPSLPQVSKGWLIEKERQRVALWSLIRPFWISGDTFFQGQINRMKIIVCIASAFGLFRSVYFLKLNDA
jgi:hypothetical protein